MTRLSLKQLSHKFVKNEVLRDVNFDVRAGEILCLVGPSGCGKTTLLRIVAGLERAQSGEVWINEILVGSSSKHREPEERNVGMVFQEYGLFPHLTVIQNVQFGIRPYSKSEASKISMELLERFDMAKYWDKYPHHLSGGEQQRVALARALAPCSDVMLMDEPFASLDAHLRVNIRDEIHGILRERNSASVMVTHDPDEALRIADRIALLEEGCVEQIGTPYEILKKPKTKFVATFFREMNILEGKVTKGNLIETELGGITFSGKAFGKQDYIVILPPESIRIKAISGGPAYSIYDIRLLGSHEVIVIRARTGQFLKLYNFEIGQLSSGDKIEIDADFNSAFVFPVEKA